MKTLLIIGGTGFFGKSILDAFSRGLLEPWQIAKVIVMSRNTQVLKTEAPQLLNANVELLSADITTTDFLPNADYVIHAAASTDVRNYITQPETEKKNIQAGTYHYCELAKKFHLKSKIVYTSSGAVYGTQPSNIPQINEYEMPSGLVHMDIAKQSYAVAKHDAELAIKQLGAEGLNVSIARCFAFVGCWLPRNQHFAIGNFIEDAINKRPIVVKTTHKVYRSYMYADDLVEWLMTMADSASSDCPIYNVGSDHAVILGDLATTIASRSQTQADVPSISESKIDRYVPSTEKAKKVLGLTLKYDLTASIDATIQKINQ
ncbi:MULTISPECIES: NAD-dependent epimerase/dehydratase family protein [Methylotenera]|uniref:NAD-dependent epimerase/dehydratase family protein n=1 Tax=Methylotenera TaxID=359407 RepID=UPI00037A4355|nr:MULTISPECIES: NAD(P)-dependent oxidoreductase [Methylotenera]